MNIGIFSDCYYPQINGVVTSMNILKEELTKLGHNVTIVTVEVPGFKDDDPDVIRIPSIPFKRWDEFRIGKIYPLNTIKEIKSLDLDIIHTQTEFSVCIFGRLLAKVFKIPVIHTYHTMYEHYAHYLAKGKMRKYISELSKIGIRFYAKECNSVIVPSNKSKQALKSYGVKGEINIIPTGIKMDNFNKAIYDQHDIDKKKEELDINKDEKVVVYVGRVSEEKSIDVLIKSMVRLLDRYENCKLLIVGDGPVKKELETLCVNLGIKNSVVFTGRVPWEQVGLYYKIGDVFVSCSTTESQGLTIYEAMASKVPVLVKYDYNIEGIITDKINGRIFYEDNQISDLLLECFENSYLCSKMSENAYRRLHNISSASFAKNIENIYNKVVYYEKIEKKNSSKRYIMKGAKH